MKLTGLQVDGFGLFHNLIIRDLSPHLTVFLGLNEAGKSTLLAFIRTVLYGFPDGRSGENPYPPLAGGRHGGSLRLVLEDGEAYTVARSPGPRGGKMQVYGARGGRSFAERIVGAGTRDLFRNIFAFGLDELQNLRTLQTDKVAEALYSAGAGVNPGSLTRLKAVLDRKENDLFAPRGTKPRINATLARLSEIEKEKDTLRGSVERYDHLRSQASQLSGEIGITEEKKARLDSRLKALDQWLRIWPEWVTFSASRAKLQEMEKVDRFPPDGVGRLEGLKARLNDAQQELEEKEETLHRHTAELSDLGKDPVLLEHASTIRMLQRERGHFDAVEGELEALHHERRRIEEKVRDGLHRLGPDWNEEKIRTFDVSIAGREQVRSHREGIRRAEEEVERKREACHQSDSVRRVAEEVLRNLPEPQVKDPKDLLELRASWRRLKDLDMKRESFQKGSGYLQDHLNELREEKEILERAVPAGLRARSAVEHLPALLGAAAAALLVFFFGSVSEWRQGLLPGGLVLLVGLILWGVNRRNAAQERKEALETEGRKTALEAKIAVQEEKRAGLEREMGAIEEEMGKLANSLSLSQVPLGEEFQRIEQEQENQLRALDRWLQARETLVRAVEREEESLKEREEAEFKLGQVRAEWEGWLTRIGLHPLLTPEGALETFSLMETLRDQLQQARHLQDKKATLEAERTAYIRLADHVMGAWRGERVSEGDIRKAVEEVIGSFEKTSEAVQKKALVTREMETARASVERLSRRVSDVREEIQNLLAAAETGNEDEFRIRAAVYERRVSLKGEMERAVEAVLRLAGGLGDMDGIGETLSRTDLDRLESEKSQVEEEVKGAAEALDRLKSERVRLEEQARQLMNDDRISRLREEEEQLKEGLVPLVEEWAEVRMAQQLLRMARSRYERDRQPEVIREAARYFHQFTLGRYPSLVAPLGENRIEVVCKDNTHKEIQHLSRGTAEELYLSLRFGFIREFSKRSEPLPIVMDEILVNFDPLRARAAAEAILALSQDFQVLFFTCHPETAGLFRSLDSHVPVLEISDGKVNMSDN